MAKRELSSTLKNLKFMQRGVHKEANEGIQEEDKNSAQQDSSFSAPSMPAGKCIVIMEGDPHPGAVRGRMSFQSFNPSIDKMNEAAANTHQRYIKPSSEHQNGNIADRSNDSNMSATDHELVIDHKRKHTETDIEPSSPLRLENGESGEGHGQPSYHRSRTGSKKHKKQGKLDWNVLRPPKPETRTA